MRGLAGVNVAWDFVELPSQIMENWCWEREALDLFARHYQTGAPIPAELLDKMRSARNFRAANAQMRQLGFGLVDLALHREYPAGVATAMCSAYARDILQQFSPARLPEHYGMIASFTHLFASPVGYGAGYYSYKWAEVLDADAFTLFQQRRHLQPLKSAPVSATNPLARRQRGSRGAVSQLHGPRSGSQRAAGTLRPAHVE